MRLIINGGISMRTASKIVILFSLVAILLPGCAGIRFSYTSQLESSNGESILRVKVGDATEVLAIGDGFPGWWGYYPWVISSSSNIASIDCKDMRGLIPFREPGVLFGGTVCKLIAHHKGTATLYFGNKFYLSKDSYSTKVDVVVDGSGRLEI